MRVAIWSLISVLLLSSAVNAQSWQACLQKRRETLLQQQFKLQEQIPELHQHLVEVTQHYHQCLSRQSRSPGLSGLDSPCRGRETAQKIHQRLQKAQAKVYQQQLKLDRTQAELSLIARNPQLAAANRRCRS